MIQATQLYLARSGLVSLYFVLPNHFVTGISYRYPGNREDTLRALNFSIERGEIFGFLDADLRVVSRLRAKSGLGKYSLGNFCHRIGRIRDLDRLFLPALRPKCVWLVSNET